MAFAVEMRAVERVFGSAVLSVNLSFVSKKAARVCEARELLTPFGLAFIRTIMLIHVLAVVIVSLDDIICSKKIG